MQLSLTSSVTVVQFMVHSSGSHDPEASQKGLTAPDLSRTGFGDSPNSVPEVPRDITHLHRHWHGSIQGHAGKDVCARAQWQNHVCVTCQARCTRTVRHLPFQDKR